MVGKMEQRVVALEEKLAELAVKQVDMEVGLATQIAELGEKQANVEAKLDLQFTLVREEMKAMFARLDGVVHTEKGSPSSERTITDKGKRIVDEESGLKTEEPKKSSETSAVASDSIHALSNREVPLFDMHLRKLEVPIFKEEEGEDSDGWLHRVERYFVVNRLTERDKVEAAVLSLEGEALSWHQYEESCSPITSWTEFRKLLLERFRPSSQGDRHARLLKLQQETTVRDYRRRFEQYAATLKDVCEGVLESKFECGLKEEIQSELRKFRPVIKSRLPSKGTMTDSFNDGQCPSLKGVRH